MGDSKPHEIQEKDLETSWMKMKEAEVDVEETKVVDDDKMNGGIVFTAAYAYAVIHTRRKQCLIWGGNLIWSIIQTMRIIFMFVWAAQTN